jgi:phosphoserine phosphatase
MTTQNLALFDLDNTLLAGDSDYNWSLFLISEGLLDAKTHHDRNEQFYLDLINSNVLSNFGRISATD